MGFFPLTAMTWMMNRWVPPTPLLLSRPGRRFGFHRPAEGNIGGGQDAPGFRGTNRKEVWSKWHISSWSKCNSKKCGVRLVVVQTMDHQEFTRFANFQLFHTVSQFWKTIWIGRWIASLIPEGIWEIGLKNGEQQTTETASVVSRRDRWCFLAPAWDRWLIFKTARIGLFQGFPVNQEADLCREGLKD